MASAVLLIMLFVMNVHMWLCRRAERLQHPPGVSLSRSGGLSENDPRGAACPGSQEHPGPGPTAAVRRLHVHVPEPYHEPVQVESSLQPQSPPTPAPSPATRPLHLPILQGRRFPERPKMRNKLKEARLPASRGAAQS